MSINTIGRAEIERRKFVSDKKSDTDDLTLESFGETKTSRRECRRKIEDIKEQQRIKSMTELEWLDYE